MCAVFNRCVAIMFANSKANNDHLVVRYVENHGSYVDSSFAINPLRSARSRSLSSALSRWMQKLLEIHDQALIGAKISASAEIAWIGNYACMCPTIVMFTKLSQDRAFRGR